MENIFTHKNIKIFLFDIDGTLMDSGGAGRRSLEYAFASVCDLNRALDNISLAGKTDPKIIKETLRDHGIEGNDGILPRLKASYLEHLEKEIQTVEKHLKPGIPALLEALEASGNSPIGLLTGNMEAGAEIKLGSLGIHKHFGFGAFGSDHEDRNMLLPFALRRYKALTGREAVASQCVVIGDTPRDVECAKPYGAMSIAVETGYSTAEELVAAGADAILKDLSDVQGFLDLVGRAHQ
jgi:phosphoglycolate phosphatase-like HAD superfamily hydrolase